MKKLWLIGITFYSINLMGAEQICALVKKCFPCFKTKRTQIPQSDNQVVQFENPMYDPQEALVPAHYFSPITDDSVFEDEAK